MKIRLFFISFIFIMILFVLNVFAEVTIHGYVYYWNLEQGINVIKTTQPENIEGGRYLPARRLLLKVEFDSLATIDEQVFTDDSGYYELTHRNPLAGIWHVDVEVRAEVKLTTINNEAVFATCYEGALDIFPYNGQTENKTVDSDETITYNVYIGGPKNNIKEWDGDEEGEGRDHLVAFFMCQVILDAFDWLEERAPEGENFKRHTSLFYPKNIDVTCYKPTLSPLGVAWIDVKEGLYYPDEIDEDMILNNRKTISQRWQQLRSTITHEYGHKIMHDVYWALPKPLKFWESSSHNICTTKSSELGWIEGWAEFFAAAILNWPTTNGIKSELSLLPDSIKKADNIEYVYYPYSKEIFPSGYNSEIVSLFDFAGMGNFNWRDCVSDTKRYMNEGENSAVLWDIFDPKGWEYLPQAQQEAKPAEWPTSLEWYDSLEDSNLEHIWEMVGGSRGLMNIRRMPDCLIDEDDVWEDSFWYYWKDKDEGYGNDTELMHGLKAIMYNRGIKSTEYSEHCPEIIIKEMDTENQKIEIEATEEDAEDQPYLYYNLAYCTGSGDNIQTNIVFDRDQPLNGDWENNRLTFSIDVPSFQQWKKIIVMVHDNMLSSFATYENNLFVEQGEGISGTKPYAYLEEKSLFVGRPSYLWGFSDKLKVVGDYAYIANRAGLNIINISNPEKPEEIGIFKLSDLKNPCTDVEIIYRTEESGEKNSYALIAYGSEGLRIVNITNPGNPIEISSFEKVIRGSAVGQNFHPYAVSSDGKYAYVSTGSGLSIIDISDLNQLVEVNYLDRWEKKYFRDISDVVVLGDYVYLADKRFGLSIIDISDAEGQEIQMKGTFAFGSKGMAKTIEKIIEIEDEGRKNIYALVVDYQDGMFIIDVTDAENPFEVYRFIQEGRIYCAGIQGQYIFVGGSKGLYALDITNPMEPEEVRTYNVDESGHSKWQMWSIVDIATDEDFIYLLYDGKFNIVSLSHIDHKPDFVLDTEIEEKEQEATLVQEMTISEEASLKTNFSPMEIVLKGDSAYIAEYGRLENFKWIGGGLRVWDISKRIQPQSIGFCDTPTPAATSVTLDNNLVFVGHSDGSLQVVDISYPLSPYNLGRCNTSLKDVKQIILREDLAFVVGGNGFQIIHIMNSSNLFALSFISNDYSEQATLSGNLLYLITGANIKIYNIADPVNPEEVGVYNLKGLNPQSFAKKNNILFLACGNNGMQMVDITDPVHPKKISSIKLMNYTRKIFLQGDFAYIWHGDMLKIVDISDPSVPIEVGSYQHPEGKSINSLAVTEDSKYIYLVDFDNNLRVLNLFIK